MIRILRLKLLFGLGLMELRAFREFWCRALWILNLRLCRLRVRTRRRSLCRLVRWILCRRLKGRVGLGLTFLGSAGTLGRPRVGLLLG